MDPLDSLSGRPSIAVAAMEVASREGLRGTLDVASLIVGWERFVGDVETGYTGSIYDYLSALIHRDWLQLVIEDLSGSDKMHVTTILTPHDNRMRAATMDQRPGWDLGGHYAAPGEHWWWTRGPLVLGELSSAFSEAPRSISPGKL